MPIIVAIAACHNLRSDALVGLCANWRANPTASKCALKFGAASQFGSQATHSPSAILRIASQAGHITRSSADMSVTET